jgi:LEA14-like dessication related protein
MKSLIFTLVLAIVVLASCKSDSIKEPEYRDVQNVRLIKVGVLETTAGLDLIYYNPNNFGVQLSEIRGDVYLDNNYFGRIGIEDKVSVGKRSEFIVPATIKLDNIGVVSHRDVFKKKEVMVRINGTARVKRSGIAVSVPIKYEGMQNIDQLRTLVIR